MVRKSRKITIKYWECRRNHAISVGGHAVDGCNEFTPAGDDHQGAAMDGLLCEACGCHRNFHRKEMRKNGVSVLDPPPPLALPPLPPYRPPPLTFRGPYDHRPMLGQRNMLLLHRSSPSHHEGRLINEPSFLLEDKESLMCSGDENEVEMKPIIKRPKMEPV